MRRELVLAEWQRGRQALRASEVLVREGLNVDAVSRAYYAVLHVAKSALEVHDVAAESHAAVRRLFGLHLIRSGEIEREWAALLGDALTERLAADYSVQLSFTEDGALFLKTAFPSRKMHRRHGGSYGQESQP